MEITNGGNYLAAIILWPSGISIESLFKEPLCNEHVPHGILGRYRLDLKFPLGKTILVVSDGQEKK